MASSHGIHALDHGNPCPAATRARAVVRVPLNSIPRLVDGAWPHGNRNVRRLRGNTRRYLVAIRRPWLSERGYLTRLAAETLAGRSAHPDLLSINASFFGHPVSGPATARIVELGSTKSLSRATLSLMQEDELKAFYVATFTDFSRTTGATASDCAGPQLPATPYRSCVSIDTLAIPDPMRSFISQFDLRLAPGALQNSRPQHTATIEGWISLDDEVSPTLASLALFADAFPPPIYNVIDRAEWGSVSTIDYAVHLKANPDPGPIHSRFLTKEVRNGLLVIDGELRDTSGQLVAESRQLVKFRGTLGNTRPAS
ncbi:thioesterase family protein [Burkholderia sp. D-99]|uniref:thioesterase family protein n=1 Tax=Burkholderia sp. D-99 TaxID=2717316 RepID=UPI0014249A7E|nr:thioesterase family protein [Burkholderia sp. D-99]NHV28638.1 thioesterase family protein [Burkholderia sp. D-99]